MCVSFSMLAVECHFVPWFCGVRIHLLCKHTIRHSLHDERLSLSRTLQPRTDSDSRCPWICVDCGFEPTVSIFPTPALQSHTPFPFPLQDDLCPFVESLMDRDSSTTKLEPKINKHIRTGSSQIGSHLIPLHLMPSLPGRSWGQRADLLDHRCCLPLKVCQWLMEG